MRKSVKAALVLALVVPAIAFGLLLAPAVGAPTGTQENIGVSDKVTAQVIRAGDAVDYSADVNVKIFRAGQLIYDETNHNLLVDVGKNWIRTQIGSTSPEANGANWVGLSTNTKAPHATDTCLSTTDGGTTSAEITTNGLQRSQGAYATGATGVYTIVELFTASGTHTDVQKSALFTANASGDTCAGGNDGTMMAAATFTAATLNSGDQIQITWTITIS